MMREYHGFFDGYILLKTAAPCPDQPTGNKAEPDRTQWYKNSRRSKKDAEELAQQKTAVQKPNTLASLLSGLSPNLEGSSATPAVWQLSGSPSLFGLLHPPVRLKPDSIKLSAPSPVELMERRGKIRLPTPSADERAAFAAARKPTGVRLSEKTDVPLPRKPGLMLQHSASLSVKVPRVRALMQITAALQKTAFWPAATTAAVTGAGILGSTVTGAPGAILGGAAGGAVRRAAAPLGVSQYPQGRLPKGVEHHNPVPATGSTGLVNRGVKAGLSLLQGTQAYQDFENDTRAKLEEETKRKMMPWLLGIGALGAGGLATGLMGMMNSGGGQGGGMSPEQFQQFMAALNQRQQQNPYWVGRMQQASPQPAEQTASALPGFMPQMPQWLGLTGQQPGGQYAAQ